MANSSIVITAVGAISAVGPAALARAAIAAGIQGISIHPYLQCQPDFPDQQAKLPLRCAKVPSLTDRLRGANRLVELGRQALGDLLTPTQVARLASKHGFLFLAAPIANTEMAKWNLTSALAPSILSAQTLPRLLSHTTQPGDRAEVLALLSAATKALSDGECDYCVIGGVDSYLFEHRLQQLDDQWRLSSVRNLDGFIPGEAAAFVLLERAESVRADQVQALAALGAIGIACEAQPRESGSHSSGGGLTSAINQAAAGCPAPFAQIYADLNGETYAAFEWGLAQVRIASSMAPKYSLIHPAQAVGDIGCATGAMLVALAALSQSRAAAPQLVFASGEAAPRLAVAVLPVNHHYLG